MLKDSNADAVNEDPTNIDTYLFPRGTVFTESDRSELIDQYKLLAQNTDQLGSRRQNLNSFFLSINSLLMAAAGVLGKDVFTATHRHGLVGACGLIVVLGITGMIICRSWYALVQSYGQMIHANVVVARRIELHMIAAVITAQNAVHGKDFLSLSKIESGVARAFMWLYTLLTALSIFLMLFMHPANVPPKSAPPEATFSLPF